MSETSTSEHSSPIEHVEMLTAENLQSPMEQSHTTNTSCSIEELQSAFGSILAADKNVDPVPDYKNLTWKDCWSPFHKPAKPAKCTPDPTRTGTFPFFSFPRELRDRIYFHYLYRPEGVVYRRQTANSFLYDKPSELITSLFLTCHQVYEEALPVFCRHNEVEVVNRYQWQHRDRHGKARSAFFPTSTPGFSSASTSPSANTRTSMLSGPTGKPARKHLSHPAKHSSKCCATPILSKIHSLSSASSTSVLAIGKTSLAHRASSKSRAIQTRRRSRSASR
jgi:hypothetical protein